MIIHLDFEISDLCQADEAALKNGVSELLRAHRRGYHLVIFSREIATWLGRNIEFRPEEMATIAKICSDYTQTGDLLRRCSDYIRVVPNSGGAMRPAGRSIDISIDQIALPYTLERTLLLVEDIESDGNLYEFVLKNVRDKFGAPPVRWELIHGGGERITAVAENKISERRIIIAVVDSDHFCPLDSAPQKVEGLNATAQSACWPLLYAIATPCREAENILPWSIVALLPVAIQRRNDLDLTLAVVEAERSCEIAEKQSIWLYLDLKKGLDAQKLNGSQASWISSRLAEANLSLDTFPFIGFGENILRQVFASNAVQAELRKEIRDGAWQKVFGDFFTRLTWICASGHEVFT